MNSEGDVILIDFGELTFSRSYVASEIIKEKRWLESWSFNEGIKDSKFREEYKRKMKKRTTLENLEKYWPKR